MSNMLKQPTVKQLALALGILITLAGVTATWAVVKYRVDDHEVRIDKVETDSQSFQVEYVEQMTRVEERQANMSTDIGEIKEGVKKILNGEGR